MEAHQLRIAIQLTLRAARTGKTAGFSDNLKDYNPIARANILEGAHGWKKDSLLRRGTRPEQVASALAKMEVAPSVDPLLLDFSRSGIMQGPVTKYALSKADSIIKKSGGRGMSVDMILAGMWSSAMMPSFSGDGMGISQPDYWYALGRKAASGIKSGSTTLKWLNGATNKALLQHALKIAQAAGQVQNEGDADIAGQGFEAPEVGTDSLVVLLFDAISNPSHRYYNRAKEWFNEHVVGNGRGRMTEGQLDVLEAYQTLGATEKGGIQGGYRAAVEFINQKRERDGREPISENGVKKALEKVKAKFPRAVETGLQDSSYDDLFGGLQDQYLIQTGQAGRGYLEDQTGRDPDNQRWANVLARATYRQELRQRRFLSKFQ